LNTSTADAVVIGAGAFGLATAWNLKHLGVERVVVLDRFAPGSQTSPRAAGLFKLIQADLTRTRVSQLAIDTVCNFERVTGVPLPVVRSGSLLMARTAEHAQLIKHEAAQTRAWGIDLEMISESEARQRMPVIEGGGFSAICHIPGDVYIEEPRSLIDAWLTALKSQKVDVLGHTPVIGIKLDAGAVAGVKTPVGEIATPVVVDAAGAWARAVGSLAGGQVHVSPVRHQLLISEPLAGIQPEHPILRIIDSAVYVRPARGGLMFGGFESDPLPVDPRTQAPTFTIADTPLDMRVLDRLAGTVDKHIPIVRDIPVAEHRGGLFTMTADGRFLVGPISGMPGLWAATGCNGSGFSSSPALGQLLAEWIVGGEPSIDISSLSPARFGNAPIDEQQLLDDCIWQYANYYTPVFDAAG
jgi:glycine/D-amino acid oxidase-like deaminating enzyme